MSGGGLGMTGVSHAFGGAPVLKEVSLAVAAGELACLLGPSGCGKTTLLRLAAGLERLQAGRIAICDHLVADAAAGLHRPPETRGVGLMFQDYALFPHLSVAENIAFGLARGGERRERVRAMMARVGLEGLAGAYPHTLSGGEQLDEPFSGLDVTLRASVREETLDLLKDTGIATLIVTHDPEEAMFMADRILVMNGATIVQAGSPMEAYFRPADAYVAALFGPINRLDGRIEGGKARTALGCFAAPKLAEGQAADVLIRTEGLRLAPAPDGADGSLRVVSARLIGRSTHLRLSGEPGTAAASVQLHARVPGTFLAGEGSRVRVAVDPERVFVFPRR